MRDEDLKKLPAVVEGWRVAEFLRGLGVAYSDVAWLRVDPRSVEIMIYATDEKGCRRFRTGEIGEAAMHRITLPIEQVWERPAARPSQVQCRSFSQSLGDEEPTRCQREEGHQDDHYGQMDDGRWRPWVGDCSCERIDVTRTFEAEQQTVPGRRDPQCPEHGLRPGERSLEDREQMQAEIAEWHAEHGDAARDTPTPQQPL